MRIVTNDPLAIELAPASVNRWIITKTFDVEWRGWRIRLLPGCSTDFASCPWWIRWLVPQWGRNGRGAVVHDALYRNEQGCRTIQKGTSRRTVTRQMADQVLYEMSRYVGMGWFRARVMWLGVRAGGKNAWKT